LTNDDIIDEDTDLEDDDRIIGLTSTGDPVDDPETPGIEVTNSQGKEDEDEEVEEDEEDEAGEATPQLPPLIIVGGSWQAIELARLNPGCLIIEKDKNWAVRLEHELPDCRFMPGDGSDKDVLERAGAASALWLVLLTGSDEENINVARTAHEVYPELMVLSALHTREGGEILRELGVQPIPCGTATLPGVLNDLIHPHHKSLARVFLVLGHPWVGERLVRVEVPAGNNVVAVRRGDELLAPDPEILLAENDTILLQCTDTPGSLVGQALSSPETVRPFHRFLVTITEGVASVGRFKEALLLAQTSGTKLMLAGPEDLKELIEDAKKEARDVGVEVEHIFWKEGGISELLRTGAENEIGVAGMKPRKTDCVIISPPERRGLFDWFLGRVPMPPLLLEQGHPPILTARTFNPYRSVLFVIDGRKVSNTITSYALRMARLFNARLHVLIYRGYNHDKVETQRRTLRQATAAYRLELTETVIESHRGLEFIHHIRSGDIDLAVTSARSRTLRRDMLVTALLRAPCSLLVIP